MEIFWQITVVESLLNLAVFAVAVIAFGLLRLYASKFKPNSATFSDGAVGVLFGLSTAVALLLPVHLSGGAFTGIQMVLLALAAPIAGPFAAALALIISVAAQWLQLFQGEAVDGSRIAATIAAAGTGIAFRILLKLRRGQNDISYFDFPILGSLNAIVALAVLWAFAGWPAVRESVVAAIIAGSLGCAMLGTLLLHEIRRYRAEQDLRESRGRLAMKTRELAVARDAAEQANRSKSAFLANMSHELRTPLNAILGFSEMIAAESLGPVGTLKYKEYAGDIHASGVHLLSLINDLLDVAKIEAGKMEISVNPIDPARVFDVVKKLVGMKAKEGRLVLVMQVLADTPPLYADERALKQILINLISNAVKFTPAGGKITVCASAARDGGFQLLCEDTGSGITPEKLKDIFVPFNQVDNRFDRQAGGTGLGLSLVRGLAELHGGRVWLESEYGKGCRAYVVLPSGAPKRVAVNSAVAA